MEASGDGTQTWAGCPYSLAVGLMLLACAVGRNPASSMPGSLCALLSRGFSVLLPLAQMQGL